MSGQPSGPSPEEQQLEAEQQQELAEAKARQAAADKAAQQKKLQLLKPSTQSGTGGLFS